MQNIWGNPQSPIDKCDLGSDVSPHWDSADMLSESCPFALLCHACSWCKAARANPRNSHVGLYKRSVTSALVVYSHSQLIWLTSRKGEELDWLGLYMIIVLNAASLNCFCCQLCSCFILPHSYRVLTFVFLTVVSYVITFTSLFSFSRLQLIYKKVFLLSSGFFLQWILI